MTSLQNLCFCNMIGHLPYETSSLFLSCVIYYLLAYLASLSQYINSFKFERLLIFLL